MSSFILSRTCSFVLLSGISEYFLIPGVQESVGNCTKGKNVGFGPIRLAGLTVQTITWLNQVNCPQVSSGGPPFSKASKHAIRDSAGHPPMASAAMFSLTSSQKDAMISWTRCACSETSSGLMDAMICWWSRSGVIAPLWSMILRAASSMNTDRLTRLRRTPAADLRLE